MLWQWEWTPLGLGWKAGVIQNHGDGTSTTRQFKLGAHSKKSWAGPDKQVQMSLEKRNKADIKACCNWISEGQKNPNKSISSSVCQSHCSLCFPQPWAVGTWGHPHATGTPWMCCAQPEPQPASCSGLCFRNILLSKSILSANQFQQLPLKTPPTFCKNSDLRCSPQRLMRVWIYASRASNG